MGSVGKGKAAGGGGGRRRVGEADEKKDKRKQYLKCRACSNKKRNVWGDPPKKANASLKGPKTQ